jgi:hypothetical protein
VVASVIKAYCRSVLANAITGSKISCFHKLMKVSIAGFGRAPPLVSGILLGELE